MCHQEVRAQSERPENFATEGGKGKLADDRVSRRKVYQIIVVNRNRRVAVSKPHFTETLAVGGRGINILPSTGIGRKHLEGVTSDSLRVMSRVDDASCNRRVHSHNHKLSDGAIAISPHFLVSGSRGRLVTVCWTAGGQLSRRVISFHLSKQV